jgi:hypothetical protein
MGEIAGPIIYLLSGLILLGASYNFLGAKYRATITHWVSNFVHAAFQAALPILGALEDTVEPLILAFSASVQKYGPTIIADLKQPAADMAKGALNAAVLSLEFKHDITPEQWKEVAGDAMADAFGFGLGSFATAAAFEALFPEKLNTLDGLAPMLATLSGFDEVTKATISPVLEAGISVPAGYDANSKYRSRLPSAGQAAEMLSRRLITQAQYDTLVSYAGIAKSWEAALQNNAYRAMSPMMLAAGFANADIPIPQLTSVLQYMGLRPGDIPLATQAINVRSLQATRQALVNEAISAYGQGVMGDDELQQILTEAGYGKAAAALAMQRALIARRITLAKESESYIVPEVTGGLLTSEQGQQQLEAAGVQPWQAELKMTLAGTKATLTAARKALAAEARLNLARERKAQEAAVASYQDGAIDAAGLTAALVAAQLDPVIVASVVAVEAAKRAGRLKLAYGQLLAPLAAKRLTEQVGAIENQFKQTLIDDATAQAQLQALGIDQPEVTALLAQWAAVRGLTAKAPELRPIA